MPAAEGNRYLDQSVLHTAQEHGVILEPKPVDRIVVTGFSSKTPFGNSEETWQALLRGESAVTNVETQNPDIKIAALLPDSFDPVKTVRAQGKANGLSKFSAMSILLAVDALRMAGLVDDNWRVDTEQINPRHLAGWISSGYAATDVMIDVHNAIKEGKRVLPSTALQMFPEQGNGRAAGRIGYQGPGGNSMEACATGASNIVEAYEKIKHGRAVAAVAGGSEAVPLTHLDESLEAFTALTALSSRNDDPEGASRPFDKDRDGFVVGSGGGLLVLESLDHALSRGATIYAEIFGAEKSMDGAPKPTEMDSCRVSETIMQTIYDKNAKALRIPDAVFAHATSTPLGDLNEAIALEMVFGKELINIPVTAIKSMLGHLMGGAGSENIISAIQALRDQEMPMVRNLDNPQQEILDTGLQPIRGVSRKFNSEQPINNALALAYGFGGYNAIIFLGKYQEVNQATV